MMIDPKSSEITMTIVCWPIEGHSDKLSWDPFIENSRTNQRCKVGLIFQVYHKNQEANYSTTKAQKYWIQEGIRRRLDKFQKMIWHGSCDHKIMICLLRIELCRYGRGAKALIQIPVLGVARPPVRKRSCNNLLMKGPAYGRYEPRQDTHRERERERERGTKRYLY